MSEALILVHANIILPYTTIDDGFVIIKDGVISEFGEMARCEVHSGIKILDLGGYYLSPGWIDAHTHGGNGFDYMNCSVQEGIEVLEWLASTGVTGVLPTIASSSPGEQFSMIDKLIQLKEQQVPGARILGFHLEGPYINPKRKGAQPESYIRLPLVDEMRRVFKMARGNIRLVTLAPEMSGAIELIQFLVKNGVSVSCGHSEASFDEFNLASHYGLNRVAHTFNGMPSFHHRKPGILGASFENDEIFCELIMDGIHVHPTVAKLLIQIKGFEKTVLITDATQAAGLKDGTYTRPGNRVIYVKDGVARLESGILAGSTLTMNRAVQNTVKLLGVKLNAAVRMASFTAANSLRLEDRKGSIAVGKDADLVVLDQDLIVKMTFIGGKIVYNALN
ncbi:MAG: N-acetylglucosamine-6-phosphate deacetylase [Anaerolineaceae bacterium]|nr:N-acetylglucosamine-6-phosphate deacetylase [Anaerolineaceae bacterium]